jgi:cysteinyl-tRNA synthetase
MQRAAAGRRLMKITLYNTFSRRLEEFAPLESGTVKMYACGPTVYNYAHIGNLRTYLFEDILRRVFTYAGYEIIHVMNITDVGHLTGDDDEGEDKMLKSSRETGRSVWEIAEFYTRAFFADTGKLNILTPTISCKATEHIEDMIRLIQRLEQKGHTYRSGGNVYFSIDTFPDYGRMAGLKLDELQAGARIAVDKHKRNPMDFVLWFTNSKFEHQAMVWDSPWGRGYPGWHIECSAMSMKYLGEQFDIHCGGSDHIQVHHTNEIAQSEAATGKKWVSYWIHGEFLIDDTGKMAKSKGDFLTLSLLEKRGYSPLDYRYFCLTAHYRSQLQFSFEALDSARRARRNLVERTAALVRAAGEVKGRAEESKRRKEELHEQFRSHISRDFNMPQALADLWTVLKDPLLTPADALFLTEDFDRVLGLSLREEAQVSGDSPQGELDSDVAALLEERAEARASRNYSRADEIRDILQQRGVEIQDTPAGTTWRKML